MEKVDVEFLRSSLESKLRDDDTVCEEFGLLLKNRFFKRFKKKNIHKSFIIELKEKGKLPDYCPSKEEIFDDLYRVLTFSINESLKKLFEKVDTTFYNKDKTKINKFKVEIREETGYETNWVSIVFPKQEEAETPYEKKSPFFIRLQSKKPIYFPNTWEEYPNLLKIFDYIRGTYHPTIRKEGQDVLLGFSKIEVINGPVFKRWDKWFYRIPKNLNQIS